MDINSIIARFEAARAAKSAAEKEEKALRALILQYAAGRHAFETDGFTVIVKTSSRTTLDTASLYKDFPDVRDVYGHETTVTTVTTSAKKAEAVPA